MTSQATPSPNVCACGCGTVITHGATWARGHFHRGVGTHAPLRAPNETLELSGQGDEFPPGLDDLGPDPFGPVPADDGQADELGPDPGPADLRGDRAARGPVKVTNALRRDINAKLSFALEIPGQIWRARDPFCGERFVEQRPAIASALTDIVCQSADLIEFMTGPAGGFMVYLSLGAACWPVVEMMIAHHVTHAVGQRDGQAAAPAPDLSRYAA
jgi:hypothetical protein